jgi:hypothetical protein
MHGYKVWSCKLWSRLLADIQKREPRGQDPSTRGGDPQHKAQSTVSVSSPCCVVCAVLAGWRDVEIGA